MNRVQMAPEPELFDTSVRQPGLLALRELAGDPSVPKRRGRKRKKLPNLWTKALPDMRHAYKRTCAYLALHVHRGTARDTVDHFIATSVNPELAYEWNNFRYASFDVNRLKSTKPFLDPFAVEDDWFALDLLSFKVMARLAIAESDRVAWDNTLKVLNEPTFCEARHWYHERYFGRKLDSFDPDEPMPYSTLVAQAPFVARELKRQGHLRAEDTS